MLKLLTEEGRQKVTHEYTVRRMVVIVFAFIVVLTIGTIGLIPSYILSNVRLNEVVERTRIIDDMQQKGDAKALQKWLIDVNRELKLLSPELDTDRPSEFVYEILKQKTPSIRITNLSWLKVKDKINLSVNGVALDRQSLIAFEDRIKTSNQFSEVTLPVSNLAKNRDIDFQIKFSLVSLTVPTKAP